MKTLLNLFTFLFANLYIFAQIPCKISDKIYDGVPFKINTIEQASFPDLKVNIKDFGAISDGKTLCTKAFADAIQYVAKQGGGHVIVPAGIWLTGPIELLDNIDLHTEQGAFVYFTDDHTQYPIIETSFEGLNTKRCTSPIYAKGKSNIGITGFGIFDANGDTWRPVKKSKLTENQWKKLISGGGIVDGTNWYPSVGSKKGHDACSSFNVPDGIETDEEWESIRDWLRPVLLSIQQCDRILLEGVTFRNSPSWCLHPLMCRNITLNGVSVTNPWYSANGDALDLESCNGALILNCMFDAGDDAICIKSGKNEEGRKRGIPCQNVIARGTTVYHGHGGFVVGSEMSGGVKNIFVEGCTFIGTDVGLRFKSTRGRGGIVENIYCENINMARIANDAILFDLYYGGKDPSIKTGDFSTVEPTYKADETTPCFRNIYIKNIACNGAGRAMYFNGLPEMRINNVTLDDITITGANIGAIFRQSTNVRMNNVEVKAINGENIKIEKSENITIDGKKMM